MPGCRLPVKLVRDDRMKKHYHQKFDIRVYWQYGTYDTFETLYQSLFSHLEDLDRLVGESPVTAGLARLLGPALLPRRDGGVLGPLWLPERGLLVGVADGIVETWKDFVASSLISFD